MLRVGERQPASERATMPSTRAHRCRAPRRITWVWETRTSTRRPGEPRVDRVVVAINPEIRLLRHAHHVGAGRCQAAAPGSGRIRARSSTSRSAGTARIVRCTRWLTRSHQLSSWSWKSRWFANRRPGTKLERMNRCDRSRTPFACGSRSLEDHPADLQLPAERSELSRRAAADRRSRPPDPTPTSPAAHRADRARDRRPRGCPAPPWRRSTRRRSPATSTAPTVTTYPRRNCP